MSASIDTAARAATRQGTSADARAGAIRAARGLIAVRGLEVSMEEVAEASGVSRRTLFRQFATREALIIAALDEGFDRYEAHFNETLAPLEPLADWIASVLRQTHRVHLRAGRGLWQLACAFDDALTPSLQAANRRRRAMRKRTTDAFADRAWASAGGDGRAPPMLVDTVALVLSSFATHSMIVDRQRGAEAVVQHGVQLIITVIDSLRSR